MTIRALLRPAHVLPKAARNYAALLSGEFLSKALAAVAFAYLARVLGPEGYGHLEFVLALVVFLTLLVDCGLSSYGAREVAKEPTALHGLALHIAALRAGLSLFAVAVLMLIGVSLDKPWAVRQLIMLYGLTLLVVPGLVPWAFQGRDLMHWVAAANCIRWTFFALGVLLFVREPGHLWLVPLVETAAAMLAVGLYLSLLRPILPALTRQFDPRYALAILRESLPIGASELVWVGRVYFGTVLLGLMLESAAVGWFGAANRLVLALHTFVWLYFFNLLPSLSRASTEPKQVFSRLIGTSMQFTIWGAVFLGITASAFARPIITMIYGPSYLEAADVFAVIVWFVPLALVSGNYRYTLIAYGRQRLELVAAAAGTAVNALVAVGLVPRIGLLGAAVAVVLSEALIFGLSALFVERTVARVPVWPHFWRPMLAGGVLTGVVVATASANILVSGSLAVLAFLLAAIVLQPGLLPNLRSLVSRHG